MSFSVGRTQFSEKQVQEVLNNFNVAADISYTEVLRQIIAFHDWIRSRWPNSMTHAEIPVSSILSSTQILTGRIDLLLETDAGWILIDHKSSQLSSDHWQQLADEYGGQMAVYARAVVRASEKKIIEKWLFLPVAAGAIRLDSSRSFLP